jgi:hypothetical protein
MWQALNALTRRCRIWRHQCTQSHRLPVLKEMSRGEAASAEGPRAGSTSTVWGMMEGARPGRAGRARNTGSVIDSMMMVSGSLVRLFNSAPPRHSAGAHCGRPGRFGPNGLGA